VLSREDCEPAAGLATVSGFWAATSLAERAIIKIAAVPVIDREVQYMDALISRLSSGILLQPAKSPIATLHRTQVASLWLGGAKLVFTAIIVAERKKENFWTALLNGGSRFG
jgi:hypothetical protein